MAMTETEIVLPDSPSVIDEKVKMLAAYCDALTALITARDKLRAVSPEENAYRTRPSVLPIAKVQHHARLEKIEEVRQELEYIALSL